VVNSCTIRPKVLKTKRLFKKGVYMKVSIYDWDKTPIDQIAHLTYEVLQNSPATRRKDRTLKGITNLFNTLEFGEFFTGEPVVICAHDNNQVIGWLMVCATGAKTAEIIPLRRWGECSCRLDWYSS
jgi:hypothetical protein